MRSNVRFLRYALLMLMIFMGVAALPRLAAAQTLNILNAATRVDYSACPIAIADPTVPTPCPTVTVLNTLDILEDTSGAVQIQADMFGWGWSVNISGFPSTWSVAPGPGVYNAATGVWSIDLTPYVGGPFIGGPVVTPPLNSDVDLTGLVVTLVDSGGTPFVTDTLNIIVDAVADTPVVTATNGVQPTAGAVAGPAQGVNLSVALVDTDGSEDFCFVMAGLPPCATDVLLIAPPGFVPVDSSGTPVGTLFTAPNMWQIPASSVAGLQIRPPAGYVGTQNFTLMATTMEVRPTDSEFEISNNISSPASADFTIDWGPPPPPPPPPPGTACDGPGPGGSTTGSIANWDNVLRRRWVPTFICMTHQLSVSMMTQLSNQSLCIKAKTIASPNATCIPGSRCSSGC